MYFEFPLNATIPRKSLFIVAKNVSAFNLLYKNSLSSKLIFGDFKGELSNGGDEIALLDSNGMIIDIIKFDDKAPWPMGADAMGAHEEALGFSLEPFRYKGLSLQRVSYVLESGKSYNWVAAVPNPGKANSAVLRANPIPVVTDTVITQVNNNTSTSQTLFQNLNTTISFDISPAGTFTNAKLEYFIEDLYSTYEDHIIIPLTSSSSKKKVYTANFPFSFKGNSIVRYRIKVDYDNNTNQVISPRSNDPIKYHGFFISPENLGETNSSVYHLFLRNDSWDSLWTNMRVDTQHHIYVDSSAGSCCDLNDKFNELVPAILGYKGQVYDVSVRYQGSAYNRFNGETITNFKGDGPQFPHLLKILSWKIKLPTHVKI